MEKRTCLIQSQSPEQGQTQRQSHYSTRATRYPLVGQCNNCFTLRNDDSIPVPLLNRFNMQIPSNLHTVAQLNCARRIAHAREPF